MSIISWARAGTWHLAQHLASDRVEQGVTQQHKFGWVNGYQRCSQFKERCLAYISYKWITECSLAHVTCFPFILGCIAKCGRIKGLSPGLRVSEECKHHLAQPRRGSFEALLIPVLFCFGPYPASLSSSSSSVFYSPKESRSMGLVQQFWI